jgi:D-3-phosphoglycerate dehydrogenase
VLVTSYDEVTDAVMAACPRLQVIACTRANPVNIDTQAAQARGIRVLYTPGRNADAAAELTLGLMLSLARHIPQSHAALKRGNSRRLTMPPPPPSRVCAGMWSGT